MIPSDVTGNVTVPPPNLTLSLKWTSLNNVVLLVLLLHSMSVCVCVCVSVR